jgi:hypothetical protein
MDALTKSERKQMRAQCSMLHRDVNQLQDMPDPASKVKARQMQLEAEQIRLMLEMTR